MARQETWNSVKSILNQEEISSEWKRELPASSERSLNKSSSQEPMREKITRMESSQRRRIVNRMNERIKTKNMQKIYKLNEF